MSISNKLTSTEQTIFLNILKNRFNKNSHRHNGLNWENVLNKIEFNPEILTVLNKMEKTGGEPDVVVFEHDKNTIYFVDCATESPSGRRSLCYDKKALDSRKEHKPKNSAVDFANEIGIKLLNEHQYKYIQSIENFDLKTSSWLQTPDEIRILGGAIFGDKRYNQTFIYHNGAESYYAARGFRGILKI